MRVFLCLLIVSFAMHSSGQSTSTNYVSPRSQLYFHGVVSSSSHFENTLVNYWVEGSIQNSSNYSNRALGLDILDSNYQCFDSLTNTNRMRVYFRPGVFGAYNVSRRGAADGSIRTLVKGGNPPYSYTWLNHQNIVGNSPTGLKAAKYLVEVRDSKDCTAIGGPINLIEP